MTTSGYLADIHAVILEQGLGKARAQILCKKLEENGGTVDTKLSEETTHIFVGNTIRLSRVPKLLKVESIPSSIQVLRADWLSTCLVKGETVDHTPYIVKPEDSPLTSPFKAATKPSPFAVPAETVEKDKTPTQPALTPPAQGDRKELLMSEASPSHVQKEEGSKASLSTETSPQKDAFPNTSRRWKVSSKKTAWDDLDSDSDYVDSGEEGGGDESGEEQVPSEGAVDPSQATLPPAKRKRRWICEFSSTEAQTWVNHNKHITDKMEELVTVYRNNGEQWRANSTTKAIQALKKHPKEITSYEEARNLPFVGERLADKIWEIVCSGRLRRLDHIDQEKERVIKMFKDIHGVGQVTAQQFYAQGYRTLEDLEQSGILNRQQLIGVRYYDEFYERMSREEVAEIEAKVCEVCDTINPGLEVVTCGSYRRGKPTCGDVDILITHPDGRSHRGVFMQLVQKSTDIGFFTDDLSIHNDPVGQSKYLGVCQLPGEARKHRRIDIFVVPYSEFPLALLHFTGSGHFNRSMRHKADQLGMSLSEHSLNTGVIRKNGVKIFDGTPLPVFSEEDVFRILDIPYREPKERDWD